MSIRKPADVSDSGIKGFRNFGIIELSDTYLLGFRYCQDLNFFVFSLIQSKYGRLPARMGRAIISSTS